VFHKFRSRFFLYGISSLFFGLTFATVCLLLMGTRFEPAAAGSTNQSVHRADYRNMGARPDIYKPSAFCDAVTTIPITECEALVALYNSTDGDNWTDNSNWFVAADPCEWYGVACADNNVIALNLASNNLNGSIPPEMGDLTSLQELRFFNNQLQGSIPIQLTTLTNLRIFYLNDNQLSGSIPPGIGNMTGLEDLSLAINPLTGPLPPELGNLSNLKHLSLSEIYGLSGSIPAELGNLSNLISMNLCESAGLSGKIPPELGNLSNLDTLWLCSLDLNGEIPPELGKLALLDNLELSRNLLTGTIPAELGNLTNLTSLRLDNNALEGDIPSSLTNLVNLTDLDVGYNKLVSSNSNVISFLGNKDPDWADTQTVAPTGLQATNVYTTSVELSWTPIIYTGDGGYYEISASTSETGPFAVHDHSISKSSSNHLVSELLPDTPYFFRVRTYTPLHYSQKSALWSEYTDVVSATTDLAGAQISVEPGVDSTLVYTETEGGSTTVQVPVGAVTETITLLYTKAETTTIPAGFSFAGNSFELDAYQNGLRIDGFSFEKPLTITMEYSDTQVSGLVESSLTLDFWDEASNDWVDAAKTCSPASNYSRNEAENWLAVQICHLSRFSLFGIEIKELYLPMILNSP
jgi:Leucine-rich repeat (LRR) protein